MGRGKGNRGKGGGRFFVPFKSFGVGGRISKYRSCCLPAINNRSRESHLSQSWNTNASFGICFVSLLILFYDVTLPALGTHTLIAEDPASRPHLKPAWRLASHHLTEAFWVIFTRVEE